MRTLRLLSALALAVTALPAMAAEYLIYTLGDPSAELVTDPYADGKTIDDYRGPTMLFVKSPDGIWLGALEVTEQQAKTMGWINSGEGKTAYARSSGEGIPANLPQTLRFPTAGELKNAWSDTPPFQSTNGLEEKYNLRTSRFSPAPTPDKWNAQIPNDLGYYDLLGNVAEYAYDSKNFIGGCHTTEYNSAKNNFETTPSGEKTCGFRLVYAGQVGKTYTVTIRIGDDAKPVGSYVAGTEVDVSEYLTAPDEDHYIDSVTVEPPTLEISPEGVFAMPAEDVTLTCVVKPYYTVTTVLTYGSEAPVESAAKHKAGDTIALPELKSGYRLCQPPAVSTETEPPASVTTAEDGSFTMPEANVRAEYAAKPYVTLTVTGGTASETAPFMGDSVTLTPTPGPHQVLKAWSVVPSGLTLKDNTLTVPADSGTVTPGASYTVTATFETAPRILVYGGTVTVVGSADDDLGNGYYRVNAKLTFSAATPAGCSFEGWRTDDSETLRTDNAYIVLGSDVNRTKTFTAVFEISDTDVGGEATLHFGLDENDAAYGNFGYTAETQATKASPNTLTAPLYKPRSEQYVLFDLTEKGTLTYADTLPEETSTTSVLPLKRVTPEGGTPFYMGVYETTSAQMAHLQIRCKEPSQNNADLESAKSNTYAYTFARDTPTAPMEGPFAGDTAEICANFDGQYGLREINTAMRLPYKEEYAAVNNGYDGTTVTEAMVNASDNGANLYERIATVDTYEAADGFYGMWGNYADSLAASSAKPTVRGQVIGGDAACTYKDCVVSNVYTETRLARICFRPVLPVTEPITVTVKIGENETSVQLLPGKAIVRKDEAPLLAGQEFSHWQWSDGTPVTAETTAAAEDDGKTLEAVFTPRSLREIAMTYEGCTGPDKLVAGSSTTVYTEGAIDTFTVTEGLTAEPNADGTALTVTAPADTALTAAKVTVTLKDGTSAKPGYRFRLR